MIDVVREMNSNLVGICKGVMQLSIPCIVPVCTGTVDQRIHRDKTLIRILRVIIVFSYLILVVVRMGSLFSSMKRRET